MRYQFCDTIGLILFVVIICQLECSSVIKDDSSLPVSTSSSDLLKGLKIRSYSGAWKFQDGEELDKKKSTSVSEEIGSPPADDLKCEKWSVVSTIFYASIAVQKQANIQGWCLLVVGDAKTATDFDVYTMYENFVFLSANDQVELSKKIPFINLVPWNHYSRKSIGYIYVRPSAYIFLIMQLYL